MPKIYSDIRQGRLCSAHLNSSSGLKAEGVPTDNQRGSFKIQGLKYFLRFYWEIKCHGTRIDLVKREELLNN